MSQSDVCIWKLGEMRAFSGLSLRGGPAGPSVKKIEVLRLRDCATRRSGITTSQRVKGQQELALRSNAGIESPHLTAK